MIKNRTADGKEAVALSARSLHGIKHLGSLISDQAPTVDKLNRLIL